MPLKNEPRIAQRRLRNQQISTHDFDRPEDVVQWFGAMQAQEYYEALWAVGLRTKGAAAATVERAIAERRIVRTWPLRGTLHFVAPNDAKWMLQHFAPKVAAAAASRHRALALTPEVFRRAERVCVSLLRGGRVETRSAVYAALADAGIATTQSRGMHIMWRLAHDGLLCYGPRAGKQPTFTLLEEWVPNAPSMDRASALTELALRYFRSHGPAQLKDFAWWGGITLSDARMAAEGAGARLRTETFDGTTYWCDVKERAPRRSARLLAHLLPVFDEYTVAYRDRSAVLAARHTLKVNAGGGLIRPIIVIEGVVRGTWKRASAETRASISLTRFGRLPRMENEAVHAAIAQYQRFWNAR